MPLPGVVRSERSTERGSNRQLDLALRALRVTPLRARASSSAEKYAILCFARAVFQRRVAGFGPSDEAAFLCPRPNAAEQFAHDRVALPAPPPTRATPRGFVLNVAAVLPAAMASAIRWTSSRG